MICTIHFIMTHMGWIVQVCLIKWPVNVLHSYIVIYSMLFNYFMTSTMIVDCCCCGYSSLVNLSKMPSWIFGTKLAQHPLKT